MSPKGYDKPMTSAPKTASGELFFFVTLQEWIELRINPDDIFIPYGPQTGKFCRGVQRCDNPFTSRPSSYCKGWPHVAGICHHHDCQIRPPYCYRYRWKNVDIFRLLSWLFAMITRPS